jgi:hypothetical protein
MVLAVVATSTASFASPVPAGRGRPRKQGGNPIPDASPQGSSSSVYGQHAVDDGPGQTHQLVAPEPERPWLLASRHHDHPYQLVHFSKNKLGDKALAQAYQNDPNIRRHHTVYTAVENVQGAHHDADDFIQHHHGMEPSQMRFYATDNHLHKKEHHEHNFVVPPVLSGRAYQSSSTLRSFDALQSDLLPGVPLIIHQTSPIELKHLGQVSDAAKRKGAHIVRAVLNHGHNSQQYGNPHEKLAREGAFLNGSIHLLREKHPHADVIWTSSKDSFHKTPNGSMNRGADELQNIVHPAHLEAASRDTFHGPNLIANYRDLMFLKEQNIIPYEVSEPHPPTHRSAGISARESIADLKTTQGKSPDHQAMIEEGRQYLLNHIDEIVPAMHLALADPRTKEEHPEIHRRIGKFLARVTGPNFLTSNSPIHSNQRGFEWP